MHDRELTAPITPSASSVPNCQVLPNYLPVAARRMTCPARKDEADWLAELMGDVGNAFRTDIEVGGDNGLAKAPVTAQDFHVRWRQSEGGKTIDQARHSNCNWL